MPFLCAGSLKVKATPTGGGGAFWLVENTDLPADRSAASAADAGTTSASVRQDYAKAYARAGRVVRFQFSARRVCSGYTAALTARMGVLSGFPKGQVDVEISHGLSVYKIANARIVNCGADVHGADLELNWSIEGGTISAVAP